MQMDRADKANSIRAELAELLREKFVDSADEVSKYAQELLENGRYWEAILFFQISVLFFEENAGEFNGTDVPQICAAGLTKCVIKIFGNKPGSKKQLKQHVLHYLQKTRDLVAKVSSYDRKFSTLIQSNMLGQHGRIYVLFKDLDDAEKLFKEAVDMFECHYESEAEKHSSYAESIGYLGFICYLSKRYDDAEKHLKRALDVTKKAKDISLFDSKEAVRTHELLLKKIYEQKTK